MVDVVCVYLGVYTLHGPLLDGNVPSTHAYTSGIVLYCHGCCDDGVLNLLTTPSLKVLLVIKSSWPLQALGGLNRGVSQSTRSRAALLSYQWATTTNTDTEQLISCLTGQHWFNSQMQKSHSACRQTREADGVKSRHACICIRICACVRNKKFVWVPHNFWVTWATWVWSFSCFVTWFPS